MKDEEIEQALAEKIGTNTCEWCDGSGRDRDGGDGCGRCGGSGTSILYRIDLGHIIHYLGRQWMPTKRLDHAGIIIAALEDRGMPMQMGQLGDGTRVLYFRQGQGLSNKDHRFKGQMTGRHICLAALAALDNIEDAA